MRRRSILPLTLVLLGLTLACTERGSLLTGPAQPEATSAWRLDYPLLYNESLVTVWGLDADDMWAGGNDGVILHFDGERCARVAAPTTNSIDCIHGRARDDVWATSGREVLHWDGRRWDVTIAAWRDTVFHEVWCTDGGEVFVGGRVRIDDAWRPAILRYDGARWWTTNLPAGEADTPDHLWQPTPGGPVLMAVNDRLYRYGNSRWTLTANQVEIRDVDGALALGRPDGQDVQFRYRFDAAGEPYAPCPEETLSSGQYSYYYARDLADARHTFLVYYNATAVARDCELTAVEDPIGVEFVDLTVPERLRPDGAMVFGVGYDGLFARGMWTGDATLSWDVLVPEPRDRLYGTITGNADILFGATHGGRLLVRESGVWRAELHAGIPSDPELDLLSDGRLVAWRGTTITVRRPDGTWYSMPDLPDHMQHVWTDGDDDGLAYLYGTIEWTLAGGQWTRTDSIPEGVVDLASRGDEIYRLTGSRVLERRVDGHWEHVLGDQDNRVDGFYLSPWSDDIYVYVSGPDIGHGTGVLRYGSVIDLVENNDSTWRRDRACEARPGDFYITSYDGLARLTADGWQEIPVEGLSRNPRSIWGHPDQGLFVGDDDGHLIHRPFPGAGD